MHRIIDIVMLSDYSKLTQSELIDTCTDLGIDNKGSVSTRIKNISDKLKTDKELFEKLGLLKKLEEIILAGTTSVTWFKTEDQEDCIGLKSKIVDSLDFNPFKVIKKYDISELSSMPMIISAAVGGTDNEYYLRFVYNTGSRSEMILDTERIIQKPKIINVYVNESMGIIEIRAESKIARKVAMSLSQLVNNSILEQPITFEQIKLADKFQKDVGEIADLLDGCFVDSTSKPELKILMDDLSPEHIDAISKVLSSLNSFFSNGDEEKLVQELKESSEVFEDYLQTTPFAALLLCGMEKVGIRSNKGDIRDIIFYDHIQSYVQQQGGYIKFNRPIFGVEKSFTIKVGTITNSIVFKTPTTEKVIEFVRDRLILDEH